MVIRGESVGRQPLVARHTTIAGAKIGRPYGLLQATAQSCRVLCQSVSRLLIQFVPTFIKTGGLWRGVMEIIRVMQCSYFDEYSGSVFLCWIISCSLVWNIISARRFHIIFCEMALLFLNDCNVTT